MNAKYFALLTAIVVATGFSQPVTHVQAPQLVVASMFNNVLVERSPKTPSRQIGQVPPPDRGAPGGRSEGASRSKRHLG